MVRAPSRAVMPATRAGSAQPASQQTHGTSADAVSSPESPLPAVERGGHIRAPAWPVQITIYPGARRTQPAPGYLDGYAIAEAGTRAQ
jgi:hypothetical protein